MSTSNDEWSALRDAVEDAATTLAKAGDDLRYVASKLPRRAGTERPTLDLAAERLHTAAEMISLQLRDLDLELFEYSSRFARRVIHVTILAGPAVATRVIEAGVQEPFSRAIETMLPHAAQTLDEIDIRLTAINHERPLEQPQR